jgi:hypothetical protein
MNVIMQRHHAIVKRERKLAELRTPVVARKWRFRMNVPMDSFVLDLRERRAIKTFGRERRADWRKASHWGAGSQIELPAGCPLQFPLLSVG